MVDFDKDSALRALGGPCYPPHSMMVRLLYWLVHLPLQLLLLLAFALADLTALLMLPWRKLRRPKVFAAISKPRRCSVIVLNWNGRHLLEESLPALKRAVEAAGGEHEVLVVDNGSQDDSIAWLQENFPEFRLLALERNLGFAEGNNQGVQAASQDIAVLLNNDMIVEEDFLPPLLEAFRDPDLFAASAQIFFPPGKRRQETGNTQGGLRKGLLELRHDPVSEAHLKRGYLPVLWGGGGSTAFHRGRFLELGGFSRLFSPLYVEDADLSYRAWRRGWKVVAAARSRVLHKHRSSSSSRFSQDQIRDLMEERKLWYLWKNYPMGELIPHFALFAGHLGKAISAWAYWRSLRKLPQVLWLRLAEAPRVYKHSQVLGWIGHPVHYLNHFHPKRAQESCHPGRLRILIVSAYLPHLGHHGGAGRVFQLLRQVASKHRISLASFIESAQEAEEVRQVEPFCQRIEVLKRGRFTPVSFFPYEPFEEFNCPRFRQLLERMLAEEDFDLVHFEWTQMTQYADLFPHTPKLMTEIEVNYAAHYTQLRVEPHPLRKLRRLYNTLQTFYREVELGRKVDRVVCVTDDDRDYLKGYLPSKSLAVVNTGVDTRFFDCRGEAGIEQDHIVFVGAFRHEPNLDAMHFFCKQVFPLILQERPQARLSIVGSSPPPQIRQLGGHPRIEVTGFVEDLRGYYRRARLVVVPLRTGVGIRGKVLEGWSCGKAMVATRLACQGIRARHGENILIADRPEDIARWTVSLLRHPEFAAQLGRNGRLTAQRHYDWAPLGERMSRIYEQVLAEHAQFAVRSSQFAVEGVAENSPQALDENL
ncbi:MAG: glycosyltransferase [Acidobacteriota bacterium]